MIEPTTLPDDLALLKSLIRELFDQLRKGQRREESLQAKLEELVRKLFGRKSEQLDPNQLLLVDLAALGIESEPEPEPELDAEEPPAKRRKRPKRKRPNKELPRRRVEHPLPEKERICSCCDAVMPAFREVIHEQLDYKPASFEVIENVTFVYGCANGCDEKIVQSSKPAQMVEKGIPGPGLLAEVMVNKYADHRVPRRRAQPPRGRRSKSCCIEDEGRPLGIGVQAQVPNHLELLGSRARVVSVEGKGAARPRQVRSKKTSVSEPLMTCREVFTRRRNRAGWLARDEPRESLSIDWAASGMEVA